jgi:hypothetical protein
MLRTMEERSERQRALRRQNEEQWDDPDLMTLDDCAREMKVSYSTALRIFRREPDVKLIVPPGRRRPIIRVPREVFERVLRRSANPWRN